MKPTLLYEHDGFVCPLLLEASLTKFRLGEMDCAQRKLKEKLFHVTAYDCRITVGTERTRNARRAKEGTKRRDRGI
jgi:hypothetical protein